MKILIVDDNDFYLSQIKKKLKAVCDNIIVANNSLNALKLIKEEKYDLIILDLLMPNMDGMQLYDEIRKNDKKVKVIFNTGDSDLNIKKDAIKKGIYAYYSKNSPQMLLNEVEILNYYIKK